MAYSEPHLEFYQNLVEEASPARRPLYSCIVGPNYALHRFSETSEKALMGLYDELAASTVYPWPDSETGTIVDTDSAKIMLENTKLRYLTGVANANLTADNGNRIAADFVVKSNDAADRDTALGTRDVQVGDVIGLSWNGGIDTFETIVAGFVPDVVPGTTDPTNAFATSFGDTTQGATETVASPTAYTTTYDATAYDGLADGYPLDTYTIVVEATGTGTGSGGTLDGTRLRITSDGGDASSVVELGVANWDGGNSRYEVDLGARGGLLQIADPASGTVAIGDFWKVAVSQTYTEVDVTNAAEFDTIGPYTGSINSQYILTVTQGGTAGTDDIKFSYRTNNSADTNGTITALASEVTGGSADYAIGLKGMTLRIFDATQFCTGDIIVFDVLAQADGPIYTIIARDTIPALAADDLDMSLYDIATVELITPYIDLTQDDITVYASAEVESDILGVAASYPVFGGYLYADYREQRTIGANVIGTIDSGDGTSTLGPAVQENPLALGVSKAREGAEGTPVYYVMIESEDSAGYQAAFDVLSDVRDPYSLICLTDDQDIQDELVAHVNEQSSSENNNWNICWVPNLAQPTVLVTATLGNGDPLQGTIVEYSPGEYRQVDAVGALFETSGVRAGDLYRTSYGTDVDGNVTYDEYVVDRVVDEETLILVSGPIAPISVPIASEIWRPLTKDEYATELGNYPTRYNNRRVRVIYADGHEDSDGASLPLYYACCTAAGQRSNANPHESLSRKTVPGTYMNPVYKFSKTQLNTIAAGGNWIITKNLDGSITHRHQLTSVTDPDDLAAREDSITTNLDDISRGLYETMDAVYGKGNASDETLSVYRFRVYNYMESVQGRIYPEILGSQVSDYEITEMIIHPVHKDTVVCRMALTLPPPLNSMIFYLDVTVG